MISDKLKEVRIKSNMTKADMARKLGVAYSTYDGYETGYREPKIETLKNIASALNVPVGELIDWDKIESDIKDFAGSGEWANRIKTNEGVITLPIGYKEFKDLIRLHGYILGVDDKGQLYIQKDRARIDIKAEELINLIGASTATVLALVQNLMDNANEKGHEGGGTRSGTYRDTTIPKG